jgi:TolB protein
MCRAAALLNAPFVAPVVSLAAQTRLSFDVGLLTLRSGKEVAPQDMRGKIISILELLTTCWLLACGSPSSTGPTTGGIHITTSTTGSTLDSDGYAVSVDGGSMQNIGINASLTDSGLPTGDHLVQLLGVAANCSDVSGGNLRRVHVEAGATAQTDFQVLCLLTGSLQVTTSTTGPNLNPDGYSLSLDWGSGRAIGINATITIQAITVGDHAVQLTGAAINCFVGGEDPRTVTVAVGATVQTTFQVACFAPPQQLRNQIVFVRNGTMYVMNADGSLQLRLIDYSTSAPPAVSPDGKQIAFASNHDGSWQIYVMHADGSNPTRLTQGPGESGFPAWSPDGSRLAFTSAQNGSSHIFAMNADGTSLVQLTTGLLGDLTPSWSPDGARIVFASGGFGGTLAISFMNADGSNRLTTSVVGSEPRWSPDGTKIAFASGGGIYIMNADSSDPVQLPAPLFSGEPCWSPDGTKLAFSVFASAGNWSGVLSNIYVMNVDGSNPTNLTNHIAGDWTLDLGPSWAK